MKIIQIATLVTPDGAYGGPVRVAVNQTRALLEAGHDVKLVAAASGFDKGLPTQFDGIPINLFKARKIPKLGFSGTCSPALQSWLRSAVGSADAVHIHMGRDLVTLPASKLARRYGVPYVLQTHGMIAPSSHPLASTIDQFWTLPALHGARRIFYLTPQESHSLKAVAPSLSTLEELQNGVPVTHYAPHPSREPTEVLFLARLHQRKRPLLFIELAKRLHPSFPNVRFALVGPDGGQGLEVRKAIDASGMSHVLRWEGAISPERTAERISRCDIYVLPSINEPFPMSVLEALALGRPTVITNSCGLAPTIAENEAGLVAEITTDSLVHSVRRLLSDSALRAQVSRAALDLARHEFGMKHVAERLEHFYGELSANGQTRK